MSSQANPDSPDTTVDAIEQRRDSVTSLQQRCERALSTLKRGQLRYPELRDAGVVYDGRSRQGTPPQNALTPPLRVFHPVFGFFEKSQDDEDLDVPVHMARATAEYMMAITNGFDSEGMRRKVLRSKLEDILGIKFGFMSAQVKTAPSPAPVMFWEDGFNGNADPINGAAMSMMRYWADSKMDNHIMKATCCPTFLLASHGSYLGVAGAVLVDGFFIQPLSDYFFVKIESYLLLENRVEAMARRFYALRLSLEKLADYYNSLDAANIITPASRYFPSTTTYPVDGGSVDFEYVGYLHDYVSSRTLRARTRTDPPRDIVVKFIGKYGDGAHRILDEAGLAPKLLYFGRLEPSDISMAVMEYIDGDTLDKTGHRIDDEEVQNEVRRAKDLLHNAGFVHKSIVPDHIIITNTNQVKLVGFDRAGPQGKSYSFSLDELPSSVELLSIIEKAHDGAASSQ